MSSEARVHHPNYVKIWPILVGLLIVSVPGSTTSIRSAKSFSAAC